MKLKRLLKKKEYKQYTTIEIIDVPNHWDITTDISVFHTKPIEKYFKQCLKRKVDAVYTDDDKKLTIKIY